MAINIPMFRLWAWDPATPAEAPLDMAVVVGRALNTQTPVLSQEMRYLVFHPYWNVLLDTHAATGLCCCTEPRQRCGTQQTR